MAFIALVHMLRDFGVSEFIAQHETASDGVIKTAFTITLIIAWMFALCLFLASETVSAFYGDRRRSSPESFGCVGTLMFQCNFFFTAIRRVGVATRKQVVFQAARVAIVLVARQRLELVAAAQVLVYAIAVLVY